MASKMGGYDCKFVTSPPDALVCLICTFVARDPQQMTCCGRIYCSGCLVELKKQSNNCPQCRAAAATFPDVRSDREIKALIVKCDNEENGCGWVGELRQFSDHTSKCEYANVECPNKCGESILRHQLNNHMKSECLLRTVKCPDCKEEGSYQEIINIHPQTCLKAKIPCPRKCGSTIVRRNIAKHLGVCSHQEVHCKYEGIGCTVKPLRKDLKKHEDDDKLHLHLALDRIDKLQNDVSTLQNNVSPLQNSVSSLQESVSSLQESVSSLHILQESVQVAPCVTNMADYSWLRSQDKPWYSPPFYTHPGGYKMCLRVHANGLQAGKGTHVSLYIHFMRGRKLNEDNLSWPFRGNVSVKLLNQLEDAQHLERTLHYKDRNDIDNQRVVEGERAHSGFGYCEFVSQSALNLNPHLNRQYLKDDCLYFQVSVKLPSPVRPWLL